jgi:hypothetical protein
MFRFEWGAWPGPLVPREKEGRGVGAAPGRVGADGTGRQLQRLGLAAPGIYQGFNKLILVSFHSFNVTAGEEVLFSLRFKTGAFVAFYGGRESEAARGILESLPDRLASDAEAALALALMGDRFQHEGYLAHGYRVHAPSWLGPAFTKRPGTGMAVSFHGAENIFLGMDDFEFVSPVAHDQVPEFRATAEKGRKLLDVLSCELAAFVAEVKKLEIEVKERDFSERVR